MLAGFPYNSHGDEMWSHTSTRAYSVEVASRSELYSVTVGIFAQSGGSDSSKITESVFLFEGWGEESFEEGIHILNNNV